jgi:hypothetical protein
MHANASESICWLLIGAKICFGIFIGTEYTDSGNGHLLAYIPSWWKNQPSLVHAAPPFTLSTITSNVVVYAPAERADTLPLFLLYPYMYSVFTGIGTCIGIFMHCTMNCVYKQYKSWLDFCLFWSPLIKTFFGKYLHGRGGGGGGTTKEQF